MDSSYSEELGKERSAAAAAVVASDEIGERNSSGQKGALEFAAGPRE